MSSKTTAPQDGPRHPELAGESSHLKQTVKLIDQRITELTATPAAGKDWARESARRLKLANLRALKDARGEPYFGRIDFAPQDRDRTETYRIGRSAAPGVTDWRAPVASLFYSRGGSGYDAPGGVVTGRVHLRRYYRIEESQLLELFDARVADEVLEAMSGGIGTGTSAVPQPQSGSQPEAYLIRQLSRSAGRQMRDIVATIQAEQDAVLRAPPYQVVVLQGVAGSGKTAVALHRVAYLLYAYAGRMDASRVLVLAPNRLLLEYVERLLPGSLGVSGVRQMTIRQWQLEMVGLGAAGRVRVAAAVPGRMAAFLSSPRAVEALAQWSAGEPGAKRQPAQGQSSAIGQRAINSWHGFLEAPDGAAAHLPASARPEIVDWAASLRSGRLTEGDLAAMAFLAERMRGAARARYDHVVVDEAQDLTPLLCDVLSRRCTGPSLTLVGDLAQSLAARPPGSWQAVMGSAFRRQQVSTHVFRTSYRSTRQIVRFAGGLLERAKCKLDLPEPVPRDGPEPRILRFATEAEFRQSLQTWAAGIVTRHNSVAVVTPESPRARELAGWLASLGFEFAGTGGRGSSAVRLVAPLSSVRGMEFDAVLVADAGPEHYPANETGVRRLYTAVTRAMHELCVAYLGDPSPHLGS